MVDGVAVGRLRRRSGSIQSTLILRHVTRLRACQPMSCQRTTWAVNQHDMQLSLYVHTRTLAHTAACFSCDGILNDVWWTGEHAIVSCSDC